MVVLFWDPLFTPWPRYTMKLISKLELKMRGIFSEVVKRKIKAVSANRTICQLDQLFQNNPEWWTGIAIIYAQPSAKASRKLKKKKRKKKKILRFVGVRVVFLDDTPRLHLPIILYCLLLHLLVLVCLLVVFCCLLLQSVRDSNCLFR